jgi:uncharacterized protein
MAEEVGMPKHGEFCWAELATNDVETCKTFYKNVFGWEIAESKNDVGMEYSEFNLPGEYPMGGMFNMQAEMYGGTFPPPHFANYIAVENVDETAARVEGLGGKLCHPAMEIPGVGRMVTITDPTGATVILLTLKQV